MKGRGRSGLRGKKKVENKIQKEAAHEWPCCADVYNII